ncbi:uncharacterized protein LOC143214281 [Lasioglossum baleicum]|uniref:uncharacterized protein LOC143214281 n=1 Tax=Lasioglossum baleicum TaxID=434251 RepID=UPI003FCED843
MDGWTSSPGFFSQIWDNKTNVDQFAAKEIVEAKVSSEKLAEYLFNASGLGDSIDVSRTVVNNITQHILNTKIDEIGRAVVKDNENREILASSSALQEGVAEKLRENPGNTKGPKGDPGQREEVGQDGKGPAPDVVAQELISSNVTKLGQAILNVKNKFGNDEKPALETHLANNSSFQESVAGNQDLRTAVTTNLSSDRDFYNIMILMVHFLGIGRLIYYETGASHDLFFGSWK